MEYRVESSKHLQDLVKQVNEGLSLGWKCAGGLCTIDGVVDGIPYTFFYQAMVKK
jgi:hypothetical protein